MLIADPAGAAMNALAPLMQRQQPAQNPLGQPGQPQGGFSAQGGMGAPSQPRPPAQGPDGDLKGYVRQGLMQRGLPAHVAEGFIANFQDESGFDPGINERNPIVAGSRGGFGLYQLTGPRRRAYESFAAERGVKPSNVDAQLDWLMHELEGPESRAAEAILSSSNAGEAASAIVRKFLRPLEEHQNRRASRYMEQLAGFTPSRSQGQLTPQRTASAQPYSGGFDMNSLYSLLGI